MSLELKEHFGAVNRKSIFYWLVDLAGITPLYVKDIEKVREFYYVNLTFKVFGYLQSLVYEIKLLCVW